MNYLYRTAAKGKVWQRLCWHYLFKLEMQLIWIFHTFLHSYKLDIHMYTYPLIQREAHNYNSCCLFGTINVPDNLLDALHTLSWLSSLNTSGSELLCEFYGSKLIEKLSKPRVGFSLLRVRIWVGLWKHVMLFCKSVFECQF